MKKIIVAIILAIGIYLAMGSTMGKMGMAFMSFKPETQQAYANMMGIIAKTGDPAQAMMLEWEVAADVTEEDVFDAMKEYAGEYNMRFVGEKNMFRIKDPKPNQVAHARIGEFCSLSIAKKMLDHSRYYGGFMPCRVIYVEYGDGRRYLVSMDMTLAIYGGTDAKKIPAELLADMLEVKKAMEEIPAMAASGE